MSEVLFTDEDVRDQLSAFYDRIDYPEPRRTAMIAAFETGLQRDGRWASVVLKDLGFEPVQAYRRIQLPKDLRNPAPALSPSSTDRREA